MITNILEYLENTCAVLPDKVALSDGTDTMTFGQLGEAAKRVGSALLRRGFSGGAVLLLMRRHPRQVAAFFGTVYAGGYYVPLDAEMPPRRMEMIFETTGARIMLCDRDSEKRARESGFSGEILVLEELAGEAIDAPRLARVRERQIDTDPIYIVFTSGSTGIPKGVVACHRSVIDYAEHLCLALPFDRDTVFGNQTPLYFDAPLKELLPMIKLGATVVLIPKMLFMFPMKLCDFLNEHRINTVCWVVSALTMISSLGVLEKNPPKYLRLLCFGSEVFPRKDYDLWRAALPGVPFYNLYGPTEATGMSCYWRADRELMPDEPIPVGRPFRNTRVLLLGEDGTPVPEDEVGREGEICLLGTCVTLGYFNNPEKTAEAFLDLPAEGGAYRVRAYRTGDIGRRNEYGELVFVSRRDAQIKHMGHRIELGEIEAAASAVQGVRRAACVYDAIGRRIVLFYEGVPDGKALLTELRGYLPRYMLPAQCEPLAVLPTTPNGKIDRRGLKEMAEKNQKEG